MRIHGTKKFLGWAIVLGLLPAVMVSRSLSVVPQERQRERERQTGAQPTPDAPAAYNTSREFDREQIQRVPFFRAMSQPSDPVPEPPVDPRISNILRMTENNRSDDFPYILSNPGKREEVYAVWVSYSGQRDELRLAAYRAKDKIWGPWNPVPGVSGDVWRPSLAFDSKQRLWVIWSQRVEANFDLFGRWFDGNRWGPLERLTTAQESDFNQHTVSTREGVISIAWQGFRQGQSDVFYMEGNGEWWSKPLKVSNSDRNDWAPTLAIGMDGTAFVVWDTYDKGNYDVVLRTVKNGALSSIRPIAETPRFEARPTIAVDKQQRLWIAYEVGPMNWGKDQGAVIPQEDAPGTPLLNDRQVEVICLEGDSVSMPETPLSSVLFPSDSLAPSDPAILTTGQVIADDTGRIHILFHQRHGRGRRAQYWRSWIATMTAAGWSKPARLPFGRARPSMRASATPAGENKLWLAWPSDNQLTTAVFLESLEERVIENVYTGLYAPTHSPSGDKLVQYGVPDFQRRPPGHQRECEQVAAIRDYGIKHNGEILHILRGDLHRHTEFSMDGRAIPDGSSLDFFRYMLDVASLDFGAMTDHQAGSEREYWWWLGQKMEDLFLAPERYVSLFGYERSIMYPYGHRNVVYPDRGHMVVPLLQDSEFAMRLHLGARSVLEGDTQMLFEEVARGGGITIPHTTATKGGGTDWRHNNPEVETLVEIFQGARHSSEHQGAPLDYPALPPDTPIQQETNNAVREKGYVWNAWKKGHRLGVIASSDHISTHMSYAMVLSSERTREAIVDAMKKRRTYGATDNIILEFWLGDHLMGEEFTSATVPPVKVKVIGTDEIDNIQIIRNSKYIYRTEPKEDSAEFTYRDLAPDPGLNYYYVRVKQKDNNYAWSSPIWVTIP